MKAFAVISLVAALLVLVAPAARASGRPRPTDVPAADVTTALAPDALEIYNDYATPAREYESASVVVHYVVLGVDAPPLNDDDGNGVPDYVERVGAAADAAIAYFERRGFLPIRPDESGPDARPDVYISRFAPGYFGVAFPAARAAGGAFVVVSNALDPSPERSFGSVYGTVAHELFHLVQFSYFPAADDPPLPSWVLEGTAAAIESGVDPALDDLVDSLQLRRWLDAPQVSLCSQSYGSQLLWRYLDERRPEVLPAYLARLATRSRESAAAALAATYARVTGSPFRAAFGAFGAWAVGEYGPEIRTLRVLGRGDRAVGSVAPLSLHVLRLRRSARAVVVRRARADVRLVYRFESDVAGDPASVRSLRPQRTGDALAFAIPAELRRSDRFDGAMLVVANGMPSGRAAYAVLVR